MKGPGGADSTLRIPALGWVLGSGLLLALVLLVHQAVGWRVLLSPWREMPPARLGAAFLLVFGSYGLRTIRVQHLFAPAAAGKGLRTFRLMLLHNLFNNLLPMRSGEASFPLLMRRELGVPFSRSLPGLFYLRLLDLHFLLVLGSGVLLHDRGWVGWGGVILLLPLPYLAYLLQTRLQESLERSGGRFGALVGKGLEGLPGGAGAFWGTWVWTGINWSVKLLAFAWILGSFTGLPYGPALLGSITGELSSVLPVHGVAGAGTYEAGVVVGLLPSGADAETALRGGVNLHLFVLGASILSGILALLLPVGPRGREPSPSLPAPDTGEPDADS